MCSCTKAVVDGNPFAGLNCEYGATKSCMTLGSDSKHSFCTNGGECQDIVGDNELYVASGLGFALHLFKSQLKNFISFFFCHHRHKDCICTDGFEGPHCEYVSGTTPAYILASANAATYSSGSPISNALVYILIAGVCAFIGIIMLSFFVRARRRRHEAIRTERELQMATEELTMVPLDMDDSSRGTGYGFT